MTTQTKKNKVSHSKFWDLLKQKEGYKECYKEMFKEEIVFQYSNGRTDSLSEMYRKYPTEYCLMIEAMKKGRPEQKHAIYDSDLDLARKRVIAVICKGIDKRRYKFSTNEEKVNYAKSIACRAANCAYFNSIPLSRMQAIYSDWCQKNKVDINGSPELDYIITEN